MNTDFPLAATLTRLSASIAERANASADDSYTAKLLARGVNKCAQKLVEEAGELAIALVAESDEQVAAEAADLLYHLLVALQARGVSPDAVAAILDARAGISGLAEKASRKG
jgi:phosphoribosyl-ATP pyrophosphohydrolase